MAETRQSPEVSADGPVTDAADRQVVPALPSGFGANYMISLVRGWQLEDSMSQVGPLIAESAVSEATNVATVLDELNGDYIRIPDYQRDSDQWSNGTKSLLVESVINNLSVPALFFFGASGRERG
jgi:hypothetical protein